MNIFKMPYSNSPIQEIKEHLNIVDIVREYVPHLVPAGSNFKARCPFHNEKTPSFMVSKEKQIWKCFGCGAGGDVFEFVKQIEGIEFPEALRLLAQKAGVVLKRQDPQLISQKTRLLDLMNEAVDFFISQLNSKEGQPARRYLKERQVSAETIKDWQIGWAPDKWETLSQHLRSKGFTASQILNSGMVVDKARTTPSPFPRQARDRLFERRGELNTPLSKGERGGVASAGYYDRFRARIMFPICDTNGSVVGFTGRVLVETEKSGGKYVNTPQTMIYDKSRLVFGLDKARQEIRKNDLAVVVEGQMDVLASHQANVKNVVACSGTALTLEQIKLLFRYTKNLALAFDLDTAGIQATKRSIDLCLSQGMNVKIIQLQEVKDPDECIKKLGVNGWQKAISEAKPVMNYYFESTFAKIDTSQLEGRREAARQLLPRLANLSDKIEQDFWLKELGQKLDVREELLRESIRKIEIKRSPRNISNNLSNISKKQTKPREIALTERLIALLLKFPQNIETLAKEDNLDFLVDQNLQTLAKNFIMYYNKTKSQAVSKGRVFDLNNFKRNLPLDLDKQVDILLMLGDKEFSEEEDLGLLEKEFWDLIIQLKKSHLIKELRLIEDSLKQAEDVHDQDNLDELSRKFNILVQELRTLQ